MKGKGVKPCLNGQNMLLRHYNTRDIFYDLKTISPKKVVKLCMLPIFVVTKM